MTEISLQSAVLTPETADSLYVKLQKDPVISGLLAEDVDVRLLPKLFERVHQVLGIAMTPIERDQSVCPYPPHHSEFSTSPDSALTRARTVQLYNDLAEEISEAKCALQALFPPPIRFRFMTIPCTLAELRQEIKCALIDHITPPHRRDQNLEELNKLLSVHGTSLVPGINSASQGISIGALSGLNRCIAAGVFPIVMLERENREELYRGTENLAKLIDSFLSLAQYASRMHIRIFKALMAPLTEQERKTDRGGQTGTVRGSAGTL